jgi:hypothetical protein
MFDDKEKNYKIIEGAYKKIKSMYFYSKDKLSERYKIGLFEENLAKMNETFEKLALLLKNPKNKSNQKYIYDLLNKIDYYIFPKTFEVHQNNDEVITNKVVETKLTNVNFLINMPIELMLLDCLWTLLIGKIAKDNNVIVVNNYANNFNDLLFSNDSDLENGIDFYSNRLFKPYFEQYSNWRNNAIKEIDNYYKKQQNTILITLDIKAYFYSVNFKFSSLTEYLNNSKKSQDFSFLTEIEEKIYIEYTKTIKKLRKGILANTDKKECIFPFELISSNFLANLYLQKFDMRINKCKELLYYGRYVDDIVLVMKNNNENKNITSEHIIENLLIQNKIVNKQKNDLYTIGNTSLKINNKKIKIFNFYYDEPKALLENMKKKILVNASTVNFFDDNINLEGFNNAVYYQEKDNNFSKFKDFSLLISDNYSAIKYITRLINISKNIINPHRDENRNIIDFYSGSKCLEYRRVWTLIFCLGVIQKNKDYMNEFYKHIKFEIDKLTNEELQDIYVRKKEMILTKIKKSLKNDLDIALATALTLNIPIIKKPKIKKIATTMRRANLFDHHLVAYPLINYTSNSNSEEFSLLELDINIVTKQELVLDERKLKFTPRFIHFEDLNLFSFLQNYKNGGNIFLNKINDIFAEFTKINSINPKFKIEQSHNENGLETIVYHAMDKIENVTVGVASILLNERESFDVVRNSKKILTLKNKKNLFSLLKVAERNRARIVVMPELYLPVAWLSDVSNFARNARCTVVVGLQYIRNDKRVFNFIANIQPFYTSMEIRYRNTFTHIREKYNYSPIEIEALKSYELINPSRDWVTIYDLCGQYRYSNRLCYEFTNINSRALLKNKVELILVSELNKDTNYFSNIIDATVRDNMCFIAQSNASQYGDSCIIGPYKTEQKNILKIKGAKNNNMLVDEIEIYKLMKYKQSIQEGFTRDEANKKCGSKKGDGFKDPPAGFFT